MPKTSQEYIRLPGKKKNFPGGYNTLWLGRDHLLFIESKRFSEDYKRFYYSDIQSIITRITPVSKIINMFPAIFCGFFTLLAYLTAGMTTWPTYHLIIAGIALIFLVISLFGGPTCVCHLKTAVQTEKLRSLNRLNTAEKAINHLRSRIELAQGILGPEELKENVQGGAAFPEDRPATQPLRHETGGFHKLLFFLLLFNGFSTAVDLFYSHISFTLLTYVLSLGTYLCVVLALVKQHKSKMKNPLPGLTWVAMVYLCIDLLLSYIIFASIAFRNPVGINSQWELLRLSSSLSPLSNPWLMSFYLFTIVCSSLIGISGILSIRRHENGLGLSHAMWNISLGVKPPPLRNN